MRAAPAAVTRGCQLTARGSWMAGCRRARAWSGSARRRCRLPLPDLVLPPRATLHYWRRRHEGPPRGCGRPVAAGRAAACAHGCAPALWQGCAGTGLAAMPVGLPRLGLLAPPLVRFASAFILPPKKLALGTMPPVRPQPATQQPETAPPHPPHCAEDPHGADTPPSRNPGGCNATRTEVDVVVVGAGISGLTAARNLLRAG